MPVYNAGRYLATAVDSVLSQSWRNLELVAVDDGSTDGSPELLAGYAKEDSRVRVVRQENAGSSAARNTALEHAQGEYFIWVDADDYVHPEFLSTLYRMLGEHGVKIAMCREQFAYGDDSEVTDEDEVEPECVMGFEEYMELTYSPREIEMVVLWNKLCEKSLYDGLRFDTKLSIDDAQLVWKLVYKAGKIAVSTKPLYFYRLNNESVTRGPGSLIRQADILDCLKERQLFLEERGFDHLAYRTRYSYLLTLLDFIRRMGKSPQEQAMKRRFAGIYNRELPSFLKSRFVTFKTRLKMSAWYVCKPLFFYTDRSRQLF